MFQMPFGFYNFFPYYINQGIDYPTLRFFYNLGHEYLHHMHYRFPPKAVTAMFHGIQNDSFGTYPNRYSGGYIDNYDIDGMNNEFGRIVTVSGTGRDQHVVSNFFDVLSQFVIVTRY